MPPTDKDDLDELARKGRENLAGRDAKEVRRREGYERFKRARQELVAECSTTWLGWLGTGEATMLGPLLLIAVASGLVGRNNPTVVKVSIVFHALLFVLLTVIHLRGKAGLAREKAWVAALPFPLEGYLPALGEVSSRAGGTHSSGPSTKLEMTIHFKGDAPKDVEAIVAGFDSKLAVKMKDKQSLEITNGDFPGGETNYPLHRFIRGLAGTVLVPLNEKSPLSRVDVTLRN